MEFISSFGEGHVEPAAQGPTPSAAAPSSASAAESAKAATAAAPTRIADEPLHSLISLRSSPLMASALLAGFRALCALSSSLAF